MQLLVLVVLAVYTHSWLIKNGESEWLFLQDLIKMARQREFAKQQPGGGHQGGKSGKEKSRQGRKEGGQKHERR